MSPPDIVSYVKEYQSIEKEMSAMKREIAQVRSRLQPHINKLKKEHKRIEQIILQHLDENGDPGIKFQNVILYKEPRKFYPPKKDRDERLTQILAQHNIRDPNVVQALTDMLKTKKVVDPSQSTLKMKVKQA